MAGKVPNQVNFFTLFFFHFIFYFIFFKHFCTIFFTKKIHSNIKYLYFIFRILDENVDRVKRANMMNEINPKFVLRNWMSVLAYEKAELGDMSILQELELLLRNPYDDQSREMTDKWFRKTPSWAERSVIFKLKNYTSM